MKPKTKKFKKVVEWDWSYFESTKNNHGERFSRGVCLQFAFLFFLVIPIFIIYFPVVLLKARKVRYVEVKE